MSLSDKQERTSIVAKEIKAVSSDDAPNDIILDKSQLPQSSKEELNDILEKTASGEENGKTDENILSEQISESQRLSSKEVDSHVDEEDEKGFATSESLATFINVIYYNAIPSETCLDLSDRKKKEATGCYDVAFPDNSFIHIPVCNHELEIQPIEPRESFMDFDKKSSVAVELKPHYGINDADYYDNDDAKQFIATCTQLDVPIVFPVLEGLHKNCIDLKFYGVHHSAIPAITETLTNNPNVTMLILEDTWLNYDAAIHLGRMLEQNKVLTHLNLRNCRIGSEGMEAMKIGITITQSLKILNLTGNDLGNEGIASLAEALTENWSIIKLILRNNSLGSGATKHLAHFLEENWNIKELDLSENNFYPKEALKELMDGLVKNRSITDLNLSWNGLCTKFNGRPIGRYLAKSSTVESINLSWNRLEGQALRLIKNGCIRSHSLHTIILDNNPVTPVDAEAFLRTFTKPKSPLAELSMRDVWVNKDFLETLQEVGKVRIINVTIGGVYSNYIIQGPDIAKLLFDRANYECMKPKSKKKKRNFGHFVLKLEDKLMKKSKFENKILEQKLPIAGTLVEEIIKNFQGPKKRVDQKALKAHYLKLYPETELPEEKKHKGKKGKKAKKKKGKSKKSSETTDTVTSEDVASKSETIKTNLSLTQAHTASVQEGQEPIEIFVKPSLKSSLAQ